MSDAEARDAWLYVEIDHPSGKLLRGKMVAWRPAMQIAAALAQWQRGTANDAELETMRARFLELTGMKESDVEDLGPGAMVNFMYRFFLQPPVGRTLAPSLPATDLPPEAPDGGSGSTS